MMGCDIHMHAFQQVGASWFPLDGRYIDRWENKVRFRKTYSHRNYLLFACLAGVRNSWDIEPISEPRGIPKWATVFERDDSFDFGDHSQTWLSLDEILNWKGWDKEVLDERLVDAEGFRLYKKGGEKAVKEWCRWTSGKIFTFEQEDAFLKCKERWKHIYVPAHLKLGEVQEDFLNSFRWDLGFLAKDVQHPTDIVLVFGFDS